MTTASRLAEFNLLQTGTLVSFRIVEEEIITGLDKAEFAVRLELIMAGDDELDAADVVEWGAFGFMFLLGALSFEGARPRGNSLPDYQEKDEFLVNDFFEGLHYEGGNLHYYGDYIRGRRIKTDIIVRPDGTVRLQTLGRGKAVFRWLARLQGKKPLQVVNDNVSDT